LTNFVNLFLRNLAVFEIFLRDNFTRTLLSRQAAVAGPPLAGAGPLPGAELSARSGRRLSGQLAGRPYGAAGRHQQLAGRGQNAGPHQLIRFVEVYHDLNTGLFIPKRTLAHF
jgi:hypothetical protein